jgi:membrane peptidoglycan carboxypeptidase
VSEHVPDFRSGAADGSDPATRPGGVGNWFKRRHARKKRRLAAMTRKKRVWRRVGLAFTWLLALFAVTLVVATFAFYQLTNVPKPTDLKINQIATITYADGSPMATIGETNRTIVPLAKVPENVRWAVLAAEDRRFYTDSGISFRGTIRAALNDIKGGDTQGGSGITQQYVKNAYLNNERTLSRKLRELAIAVKLDREYSKDQILEWYLNTIYFGRGAYGIEAASRAYFGVDVDKLTVTQGAMLAGLIQAPADYDPATALKLATDRWNYVLDGMVTIKKLSATDRAAQVFPPTIAPTTAQLGGTGPTALIVRQVRAELSKIGIDESTLNTGGLVIQTTLNPVAQGAAQTAIDKVYGTLTPKQIEDKLREALVAVDPATGGVLAYYGGSNGTGVDYAQAWRPPGSSFKPFTLAAVLDANLAGVKPAYAINSTVDGRQPYVVDGLKIYNDPGDASYSYSQPITQAMKVSLNTAFARLAVQVGPDAVAAAAHTAGIAAVKTSTAYDEAGKPTLVDEGGHANATIGFGSYAVRPIDQATAFATFASGGVKHDSFFVQKVTTSTGKTIYSHKDNGVRAFDPRVANDVTVSMNQVASWSGDGLANGRPSAAKTGTVGLEANQGGNSDAWMVGFTPQVSAAVWTGNDQSSIPVVNKSGGQLYGSNMPGQAWKIFMDTYLANAPKAAVATKQAIFNGTNPTSSSVPRSTPPPSSSAPVTPRPTPTPTPTPAPTTPRAPSTPVTPTTADTTTKPAVPPGRRVGG